MPIRAPLPAAALRAARPNWLTGGLLKLGLLSLFIVLVGMVPLHLTRTSAIVSACVAAGVAAAALAVFLGAARRFARALPVLEAGTRFTDAVLTELRRVGLPLLGLVFFLVWTFVYIALWAVHPNEAFEGLKPEPRFADFFYYAVSTALVSPPGDIVAGSRGARSATMIEMLTSFALLATYLSSFVDWRAHSSASSENSVASTRRPS
jgi:hypothetical protein